jgi:phosphonate transport system substrate-binding protein
MVASGAPALYTAGVTELRFLSYLAPSIPAGLFEGVVSGLGRALGVTTRLDFETRTSAPPPGWPDPFSLGEADVGFMCAPGLFWLKDVVELVGAAPVFDDPRANGRPVYFADVVVPASSGVRSLAELRGTLCCYNDECSLSGYYSLVRATGPRFFRALVASGSHLKSLDMLRDGHVDAAAIDSTVLRLRSGALGDSLRVVESLGPFPIQPIVARASLPASLRRDLAQALLTFDVSELAHYGLVRFAPVSDADYACEAAFVEEHTPVQPPRRVARPRSTEVQA